MSATGGFRLTARPRMTRRDDSLIGQVVAANVLLVALTLLAASLVAGLDLQVASERWQFLVLALAIMLTLCVNMWMLQRRFRPFERLIERIEQVDPAAPGRAGPHLGAAGGGDRPPGRVVPAPARARGAGAPPLGPARDARAGGGAPPPRPGPPRRGEPGPHRDPAAPRGAGPGVPAEHAQEVAELKRLVNQAMDELLNLARQLRPSALDDHGLVPAIDAQLKRFAARTGVEVRMQAQGDVEALEEDVQTAVYRVAQEALTNAERHAGADRRGGGAGGGARTAPSCACATTAAASTPVAPRAPAGPGVHGTRAPRHGRAGPAGGRRARRALGARTAAPP